ncbi:MFS transporter [Bacillus sp. JJ1532]|uniref:MFS transporter n=1 Tax=unclassified Bacillus (in: firmicutes) TaxID=185979 RepID=UPI002FFEF7EB
MKKQPLWTKGFLSISITSFFMFIGFYILLTTLPIYVLDDLNGNGTQVGLITSVFLIAAVLIRPLSGKWLDEIGRKKILFIALILFFVSSIFYFWANTMPTLLILRFVHGIGFGMVTTAAGAIAADIVPNERKGEGLGYYSMFMNLAMVMGPFAGLTIIQYSSFNSLFMLCSILSFLAILLSFAVQLPKGNTLESKPAQPQKLSIDSLFEKKAIPVSIVAGILAISYSGILAFISVYAKELGLIEAASFFFVVYAAAMLISRPFTGKWFDLYGENKIIYPAIILFAIGMFLLSQATTTFGFLLAGVIIGLGYGSLTPCLQTIAIKNSDPSRRGLATSTFFTFFDTGIGLGSYVLGIIAAYTSFSTVYFILVGVIFLALFAYFLLHGKKALLPQSRKTSEV